MAKRTMQVYARKLLDYAEVDGVLNEVDEIVIVDKNGCEIVLSLYRARTDGRIELRTTEGRIVVLPHSANVVEIKSERF